MRQDRRSAKPAANARLASLYQRFPEPESLKHLQAPGLYTQGSRLKRLSTAACVRPVGPAPTISTLRVALSMRRLRTGH
jgi:hypothetical protein